MGRKSSADEELADEGPVHSPTGRHYAKWSEKFDQTSKTKEQKKQKPKTNKTATKTPNKKLAQWHRATHGSKR